MKILTILESIYDDLKIRYYRQAIHNNEAVDSAVEQFINLKNKNLLSKEEKDISQWLRRDWWEFQDFMDSVSQRLSNKATKKAKKSESLRLFENNNYLVIAPLSNAAGCLYGKGTKWCTSSNSDENNPLHRMLYELNRQVFYVLNKKTDQKMAVLYYADSEEVMFYDEQDEEMLYEDYLDFIDHDSRLLNFKSWSKLINSKLSQI